MKLTTCFDSHLIDNGLWMFGFNINAEGISPEFIEKAKNADEGYYSSKCFWFRVYYEKVEDALPDMRCDLMYTLYNGMDIEMDYPLSDEAKKCLLEKIKKEIK